MPPFDTRPEYPSDAPTIRTLICKAFDDHDTADFAQAVRDQAEVCLAQVAVSAGLIIGHAQWCAAPLTVDGRAVRGAYLTCLSVDPDRQRDGVGSQLVRQGLTRLVQDGYEVASLLGDPAYYGRFGFSSDLATRIEAPHRSRGAGFQALELVAGTLAGTSIIANFPAVIAPSDDDTTIA